MKKLLYFVPVGRNVKQDLKHYFSCLAFCFLVSLCHLFPLFSARQALLSGRVTMMKPFVLIIQHSLLLFPFLSLFCLAYILFYYQMHNTEAKTIYLMKRLPDSWSLYRRCFSLPIFLALFSLVFAIALFFLYYGIYYLATPKGFFIEGQLGMVFDYWTQGIEPIQNNTISW